MGRSSVTALAALGLALLAWSPPTEGAGGLRKTLRHMARAGDVASATRRISRAVEGAERAATAARHTAALVDGAQAAREATRVTQQGMELQADLLAAALRDGSGPSARLLAHDGRRWQLVEPGGGRSHRSREPGELVADTAATDLYVHPSALLADAHDLPVGVRLMNRVGKPRPWLLRADPAGSPRVHPDPASARKLFEATLDSAQIADQGYDVYQMGLEMALNAPKEDGYDARGLTVAAIGSPCVARHLGIWGADTPEALFEELEEFEPSRLLVFTGSQVDLRTLAEAFADDGLHQLIGVAVPDASCSDARLLELVHTALGQVRRGAEVPLLLWYPLEDMALDSREPLLACGWVSSTSASVPVDELCWMVPTRVAGHDGMPPWWVFALGIGAVVVGFGGVLYKERRDERARRELDGLGS